MIKEIIGYLLITLGLISSLAGIIGLYRLDTFYKKSLVSGNVDTVGLLLILAGTACFAPDYSYTSKIVFIMLLALVTTPLSSHAIVRSAYYSGQHE